jgi:hypothetical protein
MTAANEVEVLLRVVDLNCRGDEAIEEPIVIVTTFVDGRWRRRELYDPHGELLQVQA